MRTRITYACAMAGTIALGLASRRFATELPWWLAKNAGDGLYATMIYFGLRVVSPRARTWRVACAALVFCSAIEFSQLYQAPWLDAIRATLPGRLVLGQGFHAFDLACYAIGVALAMLLELATRRALRRSPRGSA
jgi:hypothetical protein